MNSSLFRYKVVSDYLGACRLDVFLDKTCFVRAVAAITFIYGVIYVINLKKASLIVL